MKTTILKSDKCCKIHANGLSTKAIQWVFENRGFFVLDLVGKSYSIVKQLADDLLKKFPNEVFEVEFTNGDVIKSENFPESKITLESPF